MTQKWSQPCELLLRAKLVPDQAGADTQVIAHIPLSQLRQLPGAQDLEDAWILACQFHHDVCIHRRGWQLILHPDGTTEARSPDGRQILYSHAPPAQNAA
jgi:hypothetical protein